MKKSHILALALVALMVCGLAACSQASTPAGTTATPAATAAATPTPAPAPTAVTSGITLNIWTGQRAGVNDMKDNEFTKYYEEKSGIKVNWTTYVDDIPTQFNLSIASGTFPDMWFVYNLNTTQVQQCIDADIIYPMDQALEQYAPKYAKLLALDPDMKKSTTAPDGHIYSFAKFMNYNNDYTVSQKLWVYEPWLKASGLPMPTTVDELETLLKYFKTHDMNGNGKADEVPMEGSTMILSNATDPMIPIINCYEIVTDNWLRADSNQNIYCMAVTDNYREGLKKAASLYAQGLGAAVTYTQNINDWRAFNTVQDPSQQIVGVTGGPTFARFVNAGEPNEYENWTPIPPIKKDADSKPQTYLQTQKYQMISLIAKTSKYPEACMAWVDGLCDPETQISAAFGLKDEYWKEVSRSEKTGIVFQLTDKPLYPNGASMQNASWGPDWWQCPVYQGDLYVPFTQQYEEGSQDYIKNKKLTEANAQYLAVAVSDNIPRGNIWCTDNDLVTNWTTLGKDISQYIVTSYSEFIMGKRDINDDAEWNAYKAQLDTMGLANYITLSEQYYFGK